MKVGVYYNASKRGPGTARLALALSDEEVGWLWPKAPTRDRRLLVRYDAADRCIVVLAQPDEDVGGRGGHSGMATGYSAGLRVEPNSPDGYDHVASFTLKVYGVPASEWPGQVRRNEFPVTRSRLDGVPAISISLPRLKKAAEERARPVRNTVRDREPLYDEERAAEVAPVRRVTPDASEVAVRSPAAKKPTSWTREAADAICLLNLYLEEHPELRVAVGPDGRVVGKVVTEVEIG